MKTKLSLAMAAALLALPLTAFAQDEAAEEESSSPLTWNLALTTSYMFRGIDLTDDKPALQGGLDYSFDNGIYIGTWGSNVDFGGDGPDLEIDAYVGWYKDLSDEWALDLMAARYNYFGERDSYGNINYNEYFAKLTYNGMLTFTYAFADDYSNLGDSASYYGLSTSHGFAEDYTFDAAVGLSTFDNALGIEDYVDWSVGVSRSFGPIYTTLMYTGTDTSGDAAEDKIVLTFKIEG